MKRTFTRRHVAALVLAVAALDARALTLGDVEGTAVVGRGLSLSVPLQAGPDKNPCIDALVRFGDQVVGGSVELFMDNAVTGQGRLRITTLKRVNEPVVVVDVRTGCSQVQEHRYTLLAQAPAAARAPPEPAAGPFSDSSPATAQSVATPPVAAARLPSSAEIAARLPRRHADHPGPTRTLHAVTGANADRLASPSPGPISPPGSFAGSAGVDFAPAFLSLSMELGEQSMKNHALAQARRRAASAAAPVVLAGAATLSPAFTDGWPPMEALARTDELLMYLPRLATASGLLALLALAILSMRRRRKATTRTALLAEDDSDFGGAKPRISRLAPDPYAVPSALPDDAVIDVTAAPAVSGLATARSATQGAEAARSPQGEGEGDRVAALEAVVEQAGFLVLLGRPGDAVERYAEYLDGRADPAPLALLEMIDLCRAQGDEANAQAWADVFHASFGREPPAVSGNDGSGKPLHAQTLEDFPDVVARLLAAWRFGEARAVLDALLFDPYPVERGVLPVTVQRELLWLYGVACEVEGPAAAGRDHALDLDLDSFFLREGDPIARQAEAVA